MITLRVLYHLARADFLERVRRYSFLIMLGLVVWLGYLSASGQFRMRIPPDYVGIVNSAWVGGTMTITVAFLLGGVGFYIVKGSISRDYETGVGQIMATTPLSRPLYMLGKWLSNFAVLGIAVLIMLLEGIVMNLLADARGFDLGALAAPLVIIALPSVGLIAALAVLFESVSWLRGGLGNVIYFFVFLLVIEASMISVSPAANPYIDYGGWQIIGNSVVRAARQAYPDITGSFSFFWNWSGWHDVKLFLWNGVAWTEDIFLSRLFFLAVSVGLVLVSSLFFDRFNPSRLPPIKRKGPDSDTKTVAAVSEPIPAASIKLTPLTDTRSGFRFNTLFSAELKLFLKGHRWWWYAIAAGLIMAQLFTPLEVTPYLLLAAWIWPIFILSDLGCRETRYDTRQIVFAAPHPIANQLPARWLAAFVVMALLGSGALARFMLAGEAFSSLGWLTGALFIPSLALVLGVLTGSGKAFEALYVFWMYALTQKVPPLDFAGLTPASPLPVYALLAVGLFASALFIRRRQLKSR